VLTDQRPSDVEQRPLKILRIIARLNVGGPARHVVLLDRGLRRNGYETLLVHGSVGPGESSLEHASAEARIPTRRIPELGPRISPLDDMRALWALLRLVFTNRPDVIHTHTAKAGTLGRLAAFAFNATRGRSRRALVVHTFHGHVLEGYFSPIANRLIRFVEKSLGALTDRLITISPLQRRDIVDRFRIAPGRKVVTIPLGLDLGPLLQSTRSPRSRERFGLPADAFVVGFVGRFVPIKDLPTLLAGFRAALGDVPRARLLLAGDGPMRSLLTAEAARLEIADRVHFIGWTEDLPDLYGALDVCVLTSLNEGTPVAAIEAMAAGTAVIATSVGGVPDVIAHGRTGLLVPPTDPVELARAIAMLARDSAGRREITELARRDVAERFSIDRLVVDIDKLYRAAVLEKRAGHSTTSNM